MGKVVSDNLKIEAWGLRFAYLIPYLKSNKDIFEVSKSWSLLKVAIAVTAMFG